MRSTRSYHRGKRGRRSLSDTTQRIAEFVKIYQQKYGYSPTIREIRDAVGLRSISTVVYHLQKLERRTVVARKPFIARGSVMISLLTQPDESVVHSLRNKWQQALSACEQHNGKQVKPQYSDILLRMLEYIFYHLHTYGTSPSIREMQRAIGTRSHTAIYYYLRRLEKLNLVQRMPCRSRALVPVM